MKTIEELQTMTYEELMKYTYALQDDIKKANNDVDFWRNKYYKEVTSFASFRNAVKSVVELTEISKID